MQKIYEFEPESHHLEVLLVREILKMEKTQPSENPPEATEEATKVAEEPKEEAAKGGAEEEEKPTTDVSELSIKDEEERRNLLAKTISE